MFNTNNITKDYWEAHDQEWQEWLDYIECMEYSLDNEAHDWA